jgi:hypothetical protein
MCGSTCFGRLHAHHQELTTALAASDYNRPDHDQQRCYRHAPTLKPEAANAVDELLMMGMEEPETCWATNKRQVINLWNCGILLINLFELYDDARTCQRQKAVQ